MAAEGEAAVATDGRRHHHRLPHRLGTSVAPPTGRGASSSSSHRPLFQPGPARRHSHRPRVAPFATASWRALSNKKLVFAVGSVGSAVRISLAPGSCATKTTH